MKETKHVSFDEGRNPWQKKGSYITTNDPIWEEISRNEVDRTQRNRSLLQEQINETEAPGKKDADETEAIREPNKYNRVLARKSSTNEELSIDEDCLTCTKATES